MTTATCCDCGDAFPLLEGERLFFDRHGYAWPPKRCKGCRRIKREARAVREEGERIYRALSERDR